MAGAIRRPIEEAKMATDIVVAFLSGVTPAPGAISNKEAMQGYGDNIAGFYKTILKAVKEGLSNG